ncbi:hypothetical protein AgCh_012118 [Apium graveolens]
MAWETPVSRSVAAAVKVSTLIIFYVALAIGSSFCILGRSLSLAIVGYKTTTLLFYKMHACIFRAPMSFFDFTSSGRIINRASTDQSMADLDMPNQVGTFAFSVIQLLGIIAVMSQGTIDPSIAGLAATYGLNLNQLQAWVIWSLCNLENKIISVERMFQYTFIPSEPPLILESNRPVNHWPLYGKVDVYNLQVLNKCQLGDEASNKEGKLDSTVSENGENWSVGQRQLQTLREHFSDSTGLAIAHRITSVLESHMVLVLSNGDEYGWVDWFLVVDMDVDCLLDVGMVRCSYRRMRLDFGCRHAS